ncbi:MAG: SusE domain-containing protein [Bacteroides xylanisolvens]|nr:MAG: SusE domain-containing protein [Bacteroides xylanisolvens]
MKKYLILLLTVFAFWACDAEEYPQLVTSQIELLVPADNVSVDLNDIYNVVFAWEKPFIVDKYQLVFSNSPDLSNPVSIDAKITPYLISASKMNEIASSLGIATGASGTVFWSVRSGRPSQPSTATVRTFTIKRLPPQPLFPSDGEAFVLDDEAPNTAISFVWESLPDVNEYTLVISSNPSMSNPILETTIEGTSINVTHQELQEIIENKSNKLKLFKSNTLYWNIKIGDTFMANIPRVIRLSGMRVFTDIRGTESITYKVAVLPYPESGETVWLAENLKTKKLKNGEDLLYNGPEDAKSQYIPAVEALQKAGVSIPSEIALLAGNYYRINLIGDNSLNLQWPDLLAPEGWKVPSLEDFQDMTTAALKVCSYLDVLRSPVAYPNDKYLTFDMNSSLVNAWGMNMAGCGTNRFATGSPYVSEFCAVNSQHMVYAFTSVNQCATVTMTPSGDRTRAIGLGASAPICVRLIYIGDDNLK